jgi:biopolymer transport protein TolR
MAVSINRSSGRSGSRRRSTGQTFTDINVTPFVDVMLVLLVIFMVTTPMLTVGVPVDLPKTHAAKMNDQVEPLVVTVDANGKSYLQETELEGDALIERLIGVSGSNPDAKIYVRGDQKINYGRVMEVMGIISAAGFNKVSLIAEMPSGPSVRRNLQVQGPLPANMAPYPQVNGNMAAQGMQQTPMATMLPQPMPRAMANQSAPAQLPAVGTFNPVTNPVNGPKVIRSK